MWKLASIDNPVGLQLWFGDGEPTDAVRGGVGASSRLTVSTEGFIDITEGISAVNINDITFHHQSRLGTQTADTTPTYELKLSLPGDGSFTVELQASTDMVDSGQPPGNTGRGPFSGSFKPFHYVSDEDIELFSRMMGKGHVPYPDTPGAPGKTTEEITELGKQLFPFSSDSLALAMVVYDWTTASFTRMVFMKIFEYTSIPSQPFPLDKPSIAKAIWDSDWPPYVPSNESYMDSFLMRPSRSLEDIRVQLDSVAHQLHKFALAENRVLTAAALALPRTSALAVPRLFSGQPDISNLRLSQFGVEFLEFPGNEGPVDQSLEIEFETAMKEYIKPGIVITTKMVWSFADTIKEAQHYSNGLLLICNPPDGVWVWDSASYVSMLSADPEKNEYVFPSGSSFRVQQIETEEDMTVITLMVCLPHETVPPQPEAAPPAMVETQVPRRYVPRNHVHEGKTNGRWCHCVKDHLEYVLLTVVKG